MKAFRLVLAAPFFAAMLLILVVAVLFSIVGTTVAGSGDGK